MAGELAKALAAAQGEFPDIPKDKVNPHFKSKYASLDGIIKATKSVLAKHGLSLTSRFVEGGLEVVLLHSSGEERSSGPIPLITGKNDMQGLGSAITYARRYGDCAVLRISADEDDDGNAAAASKGKPATQQSAAPSSPPKTPSARPKPTPEQSIRSTQTPACLADLLKKWQAQAPVGSNPQKWQDTMEAAENHQNKMVESGKWTKEAASESSAAIMSIFDQLKTASQGQEVFGGA